MTKDMKMLKLAVMFTDNMVLQQMADLPVWGVAGPGMRVTVRFAGQEKTVSANADGDWRVTLEPLPANSTPQEMNITMNDSARTAITLRNILIGEVWICSGQSNMGFPVARAKDGVKESSEADFPGIRLLIIPTLVAETPQKHIAAGAWEVCSPATISGFSAVGYYFGRELHRRLGVPVGLIKASLGGTVAEAWIRDLGITNVPFGVAGNHRMQGERNENIEIFERRETMQSVVSRHAPKGRQSSGRFRRLSILIYSRIYSLVVSWKQLKSLAANGILVISRSLSRKALLGNPGLSELVTRYDKAVSNPGESLARYKEEVELIGQKTKDVENEGYPRGWADIPNPPGEWNDMELPSSWQKRGLDFSGILWFRRELELPEGWHGQELRLSIGATDKGDVTYFNNVKVGGITMADRQDSWCLWRTYVIPSNLVRTGKAVIAVRVHSNGYAGGMIGPAAAMRLSCPALPESSPVPLAGVWKYAVESNYGRIAIPVIPPGPDNPNYPGLLFNGMIFPLIPLAIRGVIWYQGESNVGRAIQYRTLFPAMIQDWRKCWNQGEFPFLFVQLPNFRTDPPVPNVKTDLREWEGLLNYKAESCRPGESEWAELREAQMLALRLPNTGMAVAIDIGDDTDLHPLNKQDVGLRLALNALAGVYGRNVPYSGPMFKGMSREGKTLKIDFDHVYGGLECRGEKLLGFAISGADRDFVWADARIDGDGVIVSSPTAPEPEFVRYAWADNPTCNLYNAVGLPAVPFRSDMPVN